MGCTETLFLKMFFNVLEQVAYVCSVWWVWLETMSDQKAPVHFEPTAQPLIFQLVIQKGTVSIEFNIALLNAVLVTFLLQNK